MSIAKAFLDIGIGANICGASFGWVDGISQPMIKGLDDVSVKANAPGMSPIDPGYVICAWFYCILLN